MHNGFIQQTKGVRAAPPAGRVGGIAAMRRPGIALVFLQPVKIAHVLRVTTGFENAHIFAAAEYVSARHLVVNTHHTAENIFLFVQLTICQLGGKGIDKITPNQRFISDTRIFANRNFRKVDNIKMMV